MLEPKSEMLTVGHCDTEGVLLTEGEPPRVLVSEGDTEGIVEAV